MDIRDRILLAVEERGLSAQLCGILKNADYEVLTAERGESACLLAASWCPQLILLSATLPDADCVSVISKIRSWSSLPLIVLTDKKGDDSAVEALDAGADDAIVMPCRAPELLARIRTAMRHARQSAELTDYGAEGLVTTGALTIDYGKRRVCVGGRDVGLTQNEYRIIALLGRNIGRVITYEVIMREVWGPHLKRDNRILRVNMSNIRRKLEPDPVHPRYVHTLSGVGYMLLEDA